MIDKKRGINASKVGHARCDTAGSGRSFGSAAGMSSQAMVEKQLRVIEARLDKANHKFDEALAANKEMRTEIDNLRKEKLVFETLYARMEKGLNQKRKNMAEIIEVANTAYEDRDQTQEKLAALISQGDKEAAEFAREMKQVQELVDKDDDI